MSQVSNLEVAGRLKAMRELCDYSVPEFCRIIGMDEEEYLGFERGEGQIPVSLLYDVSNALGVEITELLTGEKAKLHIYSYTKKGQGIAAERNDAYYYESLAHNFAGRRIEPLLVTVPKLSEDEPWHFNAHVGHEYHYCLEGEFKIRIDQHEIHMHPGDSLYFDSGYMHAMKAVSDEPAKILVVVI